MQRLIDILGKFPGKRAAVIGDVMLDCYVFGEVDELDHETGRNVPVMREESRKYIPGGAANTASNIKSLGGEVSLFGFIGPDEEGNVLSGSLNERGVKFFPSYSRKTIVKTRYLVKNHHMLRTDFEDHDVKASSDYGHFEREVRKADIVVVSDYAKGTISGELMDRIRGYGKMIVVDPKPQNIALYRGVYLVKMNKKEALGAARTPDFYEAGERLKQMLGSKVIVTRGENGMSIFNEGVKDIPTMAREVYDVTGAGDTVLAALAMALASGASVEDSAVLANYAAGIAVERVGNASVKLEELKRRIVEK